MKVARGSNLLVAISLGSVSLAMFFVFTLFPADIPGTPLRMPSDQLPVPGIASTLSVRSSYWLRKSAMQSHPFLDSLHLAALESLRTSINPLFRKRAGESLAEFLARANAHVYRLTDHCDTIESFIGPRDSAGTAMYGVNIPGAVACGLCGQRAYWVAGLLGQSDIRGILLGLNGHVVLAVPDEKSGRHWILDPDYGADPFLVDLGSAKEMRAAAASHYRFLAAAGWGELFDMIVAFYASTEDNAFYDMSYLAHLEFLQTRWLHRLWPSVMASLRQEARSETRMTAAVAATPHDMKVARALHAALVAAERKYGIAGHRAQKVELADDDFLSRSIAVDPATGKRQLTIVNWGYRTIRSNPFDTALTGCRLPADATGEIVVPPHSSVSLTLDGTCTSSGQTGAGIHVD